MLSERLFIQRMKFATLLVTPSPESAGESRNDANWKETIWGGVQRLFAAFLILTCAPLFPIVYLAVRLTSPGAFLYAQFRPGLGGRLFKAYKIRTMVKNADRDPQNARSVNSTNTSVTRVGRVLRELKLDELPQLWNVVRGEMLLVGPRPIEPNFQKELEGEIPGFARRLTVKPGLSSLGQVCVLESKEQKDVLDDWRLRAEAEHHYLDHRSITYDLVVIGLTALYFMKKFVRRFGSRTRLPLVVCFSLLVGSLLVGCSSGLSLVGFTEKGGVQTMTLPKNLPEANSALIDVRNVSVEAGPITPVERIYRIGPGDQLEIDVFGEPGMSKLLVRADADGFIQLPAIELVRVAGLTARQVQKKLKRAYGKTFIKPWVVVRVSKYRSRPIYLLGQFNKPGVVYLDGTTNVVQALAHGGGLSDDAYLRGARILRGEAVMPVDIYGLLRQGRITQNVWLAPGDTIFVPHRRDQKVFMLGAVAKPGAIVIGETGLSLLEALGQTEGPLRAEAKTSKVRIIRTVSVVEGQLILVDVERILRGEAPDFRLIAGDIVFVPLNGMADWNDTIKAIAPAIQLVGGVLQPFVQLKFLRDD